MSEIDTDRIENVVEVRIVFANITVPEVDEIVTEVIDNALQESGNDLYIIFNPEDITDQVRGVVDDSGDSNE